MSERNGHLQNLLDFIKSNSNHEYNFDKIYKKLQEEYNNEKKRLDDLNQNFYLNNLRQTIEKQAKSYLDATKRKKNCRKEFDDFIENFERDVNEELNMS